MKVAVLLLLLFFCPSPADSQGEVDGFTLPENTRKEVDVPLTLPALWDELKGLKELVLSLRAAEVEQRLALRAMETRLRDREVEAQEQRGSVRALEEAMSEQEEELRSTELRMDTGRSLLTERNSALTSKVEELERHSTIQATELLMLKSRLNNSSILMEDLENMNTALMAELPFLQLRLRASESTVEQLRVKTSGLAARMCKAEGLLEELKMPNSESEGSLQTDTSELETRLEVHLEEVTQHRGAAASHLSALHSRLDALEEEVNKSPGNGVILSRLSSVENGLKEGERRLAELMTECGAHSANLSRLENGLSVSQSRLDDLQTESTELENRVMSAETTLQHLMGENTACTKTVRGLQGHVEALKTESSAQTSKLLDLERDLTVRHNGLDTVNKAREAELWAVTLRLNSTEYRIHHLTTEHTVLQVRVRGSEAAVQELDSEVEGLGNRLSSCEKQLNVLRTENTELQSRLNVSKKQLNELKKETEDVSSRLNVTEDQLEQLRNTNADELKVAFSAGLTDSGSVGPFDEEKTLIFTKTFINVGRAYNQTAGVFTAPLRGVYFFSFTVADFLKGYMGVYLYKNRQPVTFNLDLNDHGGYASASNGVALQLDEGDVVCLRLPASYRLYDDSRNFSIFSGFLLFPL